MNQGVLRGEGDSPLLLRGLRKTGQSPVLWRGEGDRHILRSASWSCEGDSPLFLRRLRKRGQSPVRQSPGQRCGGGGGLLGGAGNVEIRFQ